MLDLRRGLAGNHVYTANPFCRRNNNSDNDNNDQSNTIEFAPLTQSRTSHNFEKHDDPCSRRIEFNADTEDEFDFMSPPLWKTIPPIEAAAPLHHHPYNDHYQLLSPTSRTEAITRGRQELMEMIKNMPESSYELSLKDLVERQQPINVIEKMELNGSTTIRGAKRKNKKKEKKVQMLRIGSMDSGSFLLKMFFPTSLGSKKKKKTTSSKMATCSKVSPRPPLIDGDKGGLDKYWLKKRFLVAGESEKNGLSSVGKSSDSSNSSRSSNSGDLLPGCWSFFNTKKSKTMG